MTSAQGLVGLFLLCCGAPTVGGKQPSIMYFMSDDQGYHDVDWSEYPLYHTPNLRQLRDEGIELNKFYTSHKCTASRSSIMTGRYAHKLGTDSKSVYNKRKNNYLPLQYKLLPAYLKDLGYSTHLVGKWHLGFCKNGSHPVDRGFDSFSGSLANNADYYIHGSKLWGYDWNLNYKPDKKANGTYNTKLITKRTRYLLKNHFKGKTDPDPLFIFVSYLAPHSPHQVPEKYKNITECSRLSDEKKRRTNCGMVAAMDESIGLIVKKVKDLGLYDDFIFLFHSDNGGSVPDGASNFPLRGNKQLPFEGGCRSRAIVRAGPGILNSSLPQYNEALIHISDWLPTLYAAAGGNQSDLPDDLDGMNMWDTIKSGAKSSSRVWMPYSIDPQRQLGAVRYIDGKKDFKLIYWNYTESNMMFGWKEDPRPLNDRYGPKLPGATAPFNGSFYRLYDMTTNMYEHEPSMGAEDAGTLQENQGVLKKMKDKLDQMWKEVVPFSPDFDFMNYTLDKNWDGFYTTNSC